MVARKTHAAASLGLGGVFLWDLGHDLDLSNEASLLRSAYRAALSQRDTREATRPPSDFELAAAAPGALRPTKPQSRFEL